MKRERTVLFLSAIIAGFNALGVVTEYPSTISISANGGSGSSTAIVGYSITTTPITQIASKSGWLSASVSSVSSAKAKTGNNADWYLSLSVSAGANSSLSSRSGSVTVWFGRSPLSTYHDEVTFYVTQAGNSATVSPTSITIGSVASTFSISVTTGSSVSWQASSGSSWITPNSTTGRGSSSAVFSFSSNDSYDERSGYVTVASQRITVIQKGKKVSQLVYTNLRGAIHENPSSYVEGSVISLKNPSSSVPGYTFSGWIPSQITSTMTGNQTIQATWVANTYWVTFYPNGGENGMENQQMTYGEAASIKQNAFVRDGYEFMGWSTNRTDEVIYENNAVVSNLTTIANGNVELSAVWRIINPEPPEISPASGTIINGDSLSISMSCVSEGAVIYYTTDGTEPTIESPVYSRFKISEKTTIKAIAIFPNGAQSDVVRAEYARGTCENPTISPADQTEFDHSNLQVVLQMIGDEGILRYTLDGSDPTEESNAYDAPLSISESTIIKAKVFSDTFFDSDVITANLIRKWLRVETPSIIAQSEFTGTETMVSISCATEGASIWYTLDGGEPNAHSTKYKAPFYIQNGCVVKAVAAKSDYRVSETATFTVTKNWCIGDSMGMPDHAFTTSSEAPFTRVIDASSATGESMRSGTIGNSGEIMVYNKTILSTKVQGPGTVCFSWKASCEQDDEYEWDHAEFSIDGAVVDRTHGITGWQNQSFEITLPGEHTLAWTYLKDNEESAGEDCIWVSAFNWTPAEPHTHESNVNVPYEWITKYYPHTIKEYEHFEAKVRQLSSNPLYTVEEAYVIGLNPTNDQSKFSASINFLNGTPCITWTPNLNTNGNKRAYKVWGRESLNDSLGWQYPTNALHRFFKVTVEMP